MKIVVDIDIARMEDEFLRAAAAEADRRGLIALPSESACQSALRRAYAELLLGKMPEALAILKAHVPLPGRLEVAEKSPQGGQVADVAGPENKGISGKPPARRPPSPATSQRGRQIPAKRGTRREEAI